MSKFGIFAVSCRKRWVVMLWKVESLPFLGHVSSTEKSEGTRNKTGARAGLACLEPWTPSRAPLKPIMSAIPVSPAHREVKAGESVQSHPLGFRKFKASLGSRRLCLRNAVGIKLLRL